MFVIYCCFVCFVVVLTFLFCLFGYARFGFDGLRLWLVVGLCCLLFVLNDFDCLISCLVIGLVGLVYCTWFVSGLLLLLVCLFYLVVVSGFNCCYVFWIN